MGNLDEQTKARIRAEEEYRAQVRAEAEGRTWQSGEMDEPQPKRAGCGQVALIAIGMLFVGGLAFQVMPAQEVNGNANPIQSEVEPEKSPAELLAIISGKPESAADIARDLRVLAESCGLSESTMADQIAATTDLIDDVHPDRTADWVLRQALETKKSWGEGGECHEMLGIMTEAIRKAN